MAILAIGLVFAALSAAGCSPKASGGSQTTVSAPSQTTASGAKSGGNNVVTDVPPEPAPVGGKFQPTTELKVTDLVMGTGPTVHAGQEVWIDYTGWTSDGKKFDTTVGTSPFKFKIGEGVLPGWDKGVAGMKVYGTRVLIVPPSMAYGANGASPGVPPNATVKFQITLLSIEPPKK